MKRVFLAIDRIALKIAAASAEASPSSCASQIASFVVARSVAAEYDITLRIAADSWLNEKLTPPKIREENESDVEIRLLPKGAQGNA